jgi:hypothetical protein
MLASGCAWELQRWCVAKLPDSSPHRDGCWSILGVWTGVGGRGPRSAGPPQAPKFCSYTRATATTTASHNPHSSTTMSASGGVHPIAAGTCVLEGCWAVAGWPAAGAAPRAYTVCRAHGKHAHHTYMQHTDRLVEAYLVPRRIVPGP